MTDRLTAICATLAASAALTACATTADEAPPAEPSAPEVVIGPDGLPLRHSPTTSTNASSLPPPPSDPDADLPALERLPE